MQSFTQWQSVLIVGFGGFFGAILRYLCGFLFQNGNHRFPVNTLLVNILGSLLLSFILYYSEETALISDSFRTFLTIGLLGAFTTLSTFCYESFQLFEKKDFLFLFIYLFATIILSLAAIFLGKLLAQIFGKLLHHYTLLMGQS